MLLKHVETIYTYVFSPSSDRGCDRGPLSAIRYPKLLIIQGAAAELGKKNVSTTEGTQRHRIVMNCSKVVTAMSF